MEKLIYVAGTIRQEEKSSKKKNVIVIFDIDSRNRVNRPIRMSIMEIGFLSVNFRLGRHEGMNTIATKGNQNIVSSSHGTKGLLGSSDSFDGRTTS